MHWHADLFDPVTTGTTTCNFKHCFGFFKDSDCINAVIACCCNRYDQRVIGTFTIDRNSVVKF